MVVTSGGDTLSFLFHVWACFLEDDDLCVYHRVPPTTGTTLDFVTTPIGQITLNSDFLTLTWRAARGKNKSLSWLVGRLAGWLDRWIERGSWLTDTLDSVKLKKH